MSPGRLLAPLLLALAASGCGTAEVEPPPLPRFGSYVAMGDSFTSGPGIAPVEDPGCGRSGRNYAHLLAERLRIEDFTDSSCGGAVTPHLVGEQQTMFGTVAPPQMAAIDARTELVTLGIGINHREVSARLLHDCLTASGRAQSCQEFLALTPAQLQLVASAIADEVGEAIDLVQEKAPEATVVLVGYPALVAAGDSCPQVLDVVPGYPAQAELLMRAFHDAYAALADRKDVLYADLFTASEAHGICARKPWVAGGLPVPERGAQMHPLDTGMAAAAGVIEDVLVDAARD